MSGHVKTAKDEDLSDGDIVYKGRNLSDGGIAQVRKKALVQYSLPFISVSLPGMAEAFNTDVLCVHFPSFPLLFNMHLPATRPPRPPPPTHARTHAHMHTDCPA